MFRASGNDVNVMAAHLARVVMPLGFFVVAACGTTSESVVPSVSPQTAQAQVVATARDVQDTHSSATYIADEVLPAEAVQRFEKAVVHMNAGDTTVAEREFRSLADAYPTLSGPLVNVAILEARTERLDAAERTLRAAIERNASNAAAYNQLGLVYRKLGRFQEARTAYQGAVRHDPTYANAYLNLGVLCDLYLQEPQSALEAYERYLGLASEPDARVSAWVLELRKRVGAATRPERSEG